MGPIPALISCDKLKVISARSGRGGGELERVEGVTAYTRFNVRYI